MNTEPIATEPVESSNIQAVGYDWPTGTLSVVFKKHGVIYHYHPVPKPLFDGLKKARSIGGYFRAFIRNSPSIKAMLWCDCSQFSETGEHLDTCIHEQKSSIERTIYSGSNREPR